MWSIAWYGVENFDTRGSGFLEILKYDAGEGWRRTFGPTV
jgi:hypothetical protein